MVVSLCPVNAPVNDHDASLRRTSLDRLRTLVPVVLIAISASLLASIPVGIPLTATVVTTNFVVLAVVGALYAALSRDRIPLAYAHAVAAVIAIATPVTTLVSQWQIARSGLVVLLILELVASALQLSTRWLLASSLVTAAAWLPLAIRDAGPDELGLQIGAVATAIVIALIIQRMLVRSLIQIEEGRASERRVNAELARELADRRRSELEREAMRDQLIHAQRLDAVGTLSAGLAHDMNNILGGIVGYAEAIGADLVDPAAREDCARIVDEAERGAVLTRSLLAFSRRGQYRRQAVSLEAIVDSVSGILTRTLSKTITVEHVTEPTPAIDADLVQLGQVIINLCINAADAMAGTGKLTIERGPRTLSDARADELELARGKRWVMLAISDTGTGMDAATVARIFEPFFTTKPLGQGTGLGLSMVYGVVDAHDGSIIVTSNVGQGTRFEILLPALDAAPAPIAVRSESGKFAIRQEVLVVDDEPMLRKATCRMLERHGLRASFATNGQEALDTFAQHRDRFALVVLDMVMPVMGGLECFRKLREISRVPIVIASGYALETETQELLASGRAAFLEKPFTTSQLMHEIERLLHGDLAR
ncbi:MAG: response regulator [Kofleriaceae bacterium]